MADAGFTKLFGNREELKAISEDTKRLAEAIDSSDGFVLFRMKQEGVLPDKSVLLSLRNPISLRFAIDNYELNDDEVDSFRDDLARFGDNKITTTPPSIKEIKSRLAAGKPISRLAILPKDIIIEFADDIDRQNDVDGSDMDVALLESAKLLQPEDFDEIESKVPEFLNRNIDALMNRELLSKIPMLKDKAKNLMISALNKKRSYIGDLEDYPFEKGNLEDEALLRSYLTAVAKNNDFHKGYQGLLGVSNFNSIISTMEYYSKYDRGDLNCFTDADFEENLDSITAKFIDWISDRSNGDYSDKAVYKLQNANSSLDRFSKVITEQSIVEICKRNDRLSFRDLANSDFKDSKARKAIIEKALLSAFAKSDDMTPFLSVALTDLLAPLDEDEKHVYVDELEKDVRRNAIKTFVRTSHLQYCIWERKTLISNESLFDGSMDAVADEFPSMNLLILVLNLFSRIDENDAKDLKRKDALVKLGNRLAPRLEKSDVRKLCKHYGFPLSKLLVYKEDAPNDSNSNMLVAVRADAAGCDDSFAFEIAFECDADFRRELLRKGVELQKRAVLEAISDKPESIAFMREYFKAHREQIMNDPEILSRILKAPYGKSIMKISEREQINAYGELKRAAKEFRSLQKLSKRDSNDEYDSDCEDDLTDERAKLSEEIEKARNKKNEAFRFLSVGFLDKLSDDLVETKNWSELSELMEHHIDTGRIYRKISSMDFAGVMEAAKNDDFRKIVTKAVGYEKSSIVFDFSPDESLAAARVFMSEFQDRPKTIDLFSDRSFVKRFAIEDIPLHAVYSYYMSPPSDKMKIGTRYLHERYSPEEILKIFKTLDEGVGFFSEFGPNASFDHFLKDNFNNDEEGFMKLLELSKTESPKLYLVLANGRIFRSFAENMEGDDKLDFKQMRYLIERFDFDVLIKGVEEVMDEIKSFSKDRDELSSKGKITNNNLALKTIQSLIWLTTAERMKTDGSYDYERLSELPDSQADKLILSLMNGGGVLRLLFHSAVGTFKADDGFPRQIDLFLNSGSDVQLLFRPNERIRGDFMFDAGQDTWYSQHALAFYSNLIGAMNERGMFDELDKLFHDLENDKFIRNEASYESRRDSWTNHSEVISFLSESEPFMDELRKICQKTFLERKLDHVPKPSGRRSGKI